MNSQTAKKFAKALGAIFLFLLLVIRGCEYIFSSLFDGMCGNEIIQEVFSPDHTYKAVVFQRDCGATTGYSTQISILKASAKLPDEAGNIFVMDGHPDWTGIEIDWKTARLVSITYSAARRISVKKESIRIPFTKIKVEYHPGAE